MKVTDLMKSKYLKQGDIGDEEVPVTFKKVVKENVARKDADPEYKAVAYFHEFEKPMVLNATNLKRIAKTLGDDTEDWIGNSMILYVDETVEFGGEQKGGLRLKRQPLPASVLRKPTQSDINRKLSDAADEDAEKLPF